MADYTSNVTVTNTMLAPLTRIAYRALQGNWDKLPHPTVDASGSSLMILSPANNVSEGDVTYKTVAGDEMTVHFKCSPSGNTCSVTPAEVGSATLNAKGAPLNAVATIIEN